MSASASASASVEPQLSLLSVRRVEKDVPWLRPALPRRVRDDVLPPGTSDRNDRNANAIHQSFHAAFDEFRFLARRAWLELVSEPSGRLYSIPAEGAADSSGQGPEKSDRP